MTFDVVIFAGTDSKKGVRTFQNVDVLFPEHCDYSKTGVKNGPKWITLQDESEDQITLNLRSWSVSEKVPEKVKVRKRDGKVIDDGYRVTGDFDRVTIYRRHSGERKQ